MDLRTTRDIFRFDKKISIGVLVAILIFTIASTVSINPYRYGVSDNSITIPFLKSFVNNNLYPNDILVSQRVYYYTLFWDALAVLMTTFHISLPSIFFFFYFVSIYALFAGVYLVCMALFNRKAVAFLCLFFLLFTQESFAYTFTIENILNTRCVATPVLLFAIYYYLNRKYLLSFFLLGIGYLVHPITAHYVIIIILVSAVVEIRSVRARRLIVSLAVLGLTLSPILIWKLLHTPPSLQLMYVDPEWDHLLRLRSMHHIFPFSWDPRMFLQGLMELVAFFIAWKYKRDLQPIHHRIITTFVIVILAMCLVGTVFSEIWPISIALVLQFFRAFQFFKYFGMMYVANYIVHEIHAEDERLKFFNVGLVSFMVVYGAVLWKLAWIVFGGLAAILLMYRFRKLREPDPAQMVAVMMTAVVLLSGGEFVKRCISKEDDRFSFNNAQKRDWLDVEQWANRNTAPEDYFIVPPTMEDEFRVESERPSYGDWEDGGLMNSNPAFGHVWFQHMNALGYGQGTDLEDGFRSRTEADFVNIAKDITINNHRTYLIQPVGWNKLNFPISYHNAKYNIYEVYRSDFSK